MKNSKLLLLLIFLMLIVFMTVLLIVTRRPPQEAPVSGKERLINARATRTIQRLGRAYAALEENHPAEAEKILQELLLTEPNNPIALRMLGRLYYENHRYPEAENIYQRLIRRNEFDASAHNNLGQTYARQDKLREAIAAFHRSLELNSASPLPHLNLSGVYAELNMPEHARKHFDTAQHLLNRTNERPLPKTARPEENLPK